ncbi:MAG: hypothetical protein HC828_06455, partial [Blastochloris sp.]|nr:hypothetical protein [Blastochloris sp.]
MRSTFGMIAALLAGAWIGAGASRRALDALREEVKTNEARAEEHYRQLEALFSLHAQVKFNAPLPPMRRWSISPDFANL